MVAVNNIHLNKSHQVPENTLDAEICIHFLGKEKGYELSLVG